MNSLIVKTLLLAFVAGVSAVPAAQQRIVGGSVTTINSYPSMASLLYSNNLVNWLQTCGGTVLTNNAILSAAHCFYGDQANRWRVRVGSTYGNSGGVVHNTAYILLHPSFNIVTYEGDIAILRTSTVISYINNVVAPASIAGSNYNMADNQVVWVPGWGSTAYGAAASEQLRAVQIWTVNQTTCRQRYDELRLNVTNNMICAGWLDVGGRSPCTGDNGSPLLHNGVAVGVTSWGQNCALARYPAVFTRVSSFAAWIQANA